MISRWVSCGHSMLLLQNSIQTHGPPSKPFGFCVTCFVSVQLLPPSSIIINPTWPTLLAGFPLLAGRVTHFSPRSCPPIKTLRGFLKKSSLSTRVGIFSFMSPNEELEVYTLFDSLPIRPPSRKLLSVYKLSQRWTDFHGMLVSLFYHSFSIGLDH